MLINESNLATVKKVAIANFEMGLESAVAMADMSFMEKATIRTKKYEAPWLGFFPLMEQAVKGAPRVYEDMEAYLYSLTPEYYTAGVKIHKHDLLDADDDPMVAAQQIGLPKIMRRAGVEAAQWEQRLGSEALQNGHLSTHPVTGKSITCFDGQPFFDAAHPNGAGSPTFANEDTSGDITYPYFTYDSRRPPVLMVERQSPEVMMKTDGDEAFDEGWWKIAIEARAVAGYSLPQFAFRSTKTISLTNWRAHRRVMRAYTTDAGQKLLINPDRAMAGVSNEDTLRDVFGQRILATGEENMGINEGVRVLYNPHLS